jgi:hypothetical protein
LGGGGSIETQPLLSGSSLYEAEFIDGPAYYYIGIIDILQVRGAQAHASALARWVL